VGRSGTDDRLQCGQCYLDGTSFCHETPRSLVFEQNNLSFIHIVQMSLRVSLSAAKNNMAIDSSPRNATPLCRGS
jgi:hypothetical protein